MADTSRVTDRLAKEFLDAALPDIERAFAPEHIILFGSRAKGQARDDSDIDLILVSDRFEGVRFPNRIASFLKTIRPKPEVEPLCYTPAEFERLKEQTTILIEATREGIWIQ
jgi:predicted nucleotidyltransferase